MIHGADNIRARLAQIPPQPINDWPNTTSMPAQWTPIALSDLPHGDIWVVATYKKMNPNDPSVRGEREVNGARRRPCILTKPATLLRIITINNHDEWLTAMAGWGNLSLNPRADYGAWHNTAFAPHIGFEALTRQYTVTIPGLKRGMPQLAEVTYHTVA